MLLKKIELSKGYDIYRRERLMEGVAKPPILLAAGGDSFKSGGSPTRCNKSRNEMSAFKTVSSMGNRTLGVI